MLSLMNEAFIVQPGEGRRLALGNFEALVLATAPQTSSEFTLLQVQGEPPDFGPPLHLHRGAAEAFYVLEGEYLMHVAGKQTLCPAGSFVYVPRDTPHTFKVVSAVPGKKLALLTRRDDRILRGTEPGRSSREPHTGTLGDHCREEQHGGARPRAGQLSMT
jgi:mannose-6-phosphate isomerase-like protein (cupin superfamily)